MIWQESLLDKPRSSAHIIFVDARADHEFAQSVGVLAASLVTAKSLWPHFVLNAEFPNANGDPTRPSGISTHFVAALRRDIRQKNGDWRLWVESWALPDVAQ